MHEKKYTAPDKIVHKMSKNGLTEENLRTGEKESIHEWQRARERPQDGTPELTPEQAANRKSIKKEMVKRYAEKEQKKEDQLQENQQKRVEQAGEKSSEQAIQQQAGRSPEEESLEAAADVIKEEGGASRKGKKAGKGNAGKAEKDADAPSSKKSRLHFEDEESEMVRGSGMGFHKKAAAAAVGAVTVQAHRKVREESDGNSGVEAAHDTEIASETAVRQVSRRVKAVKTTEPEASIKDKTQKFYQKQRYKKAYKEAKRTGKTAENTAMAEQTTAEKIKAVLSQTFRNNRTLLIVLGVCGLLFGLMAVAVSSTSTIVQGLGGAVMTTTYPSSDNDIHRAENAYVEMEQALNEQINNIETSHPSYDEYRYQVDEIGHNPYQLISYLTAVYGDFKYADVRSELEALFSRQYRLEVTEQIETRTRTETRTGTTSYTDPETGETYDEDYEYEVEVEYDYYILCISLKNLGFDIIARNRMTADQIRHYDILNTTYGNRDDLFDLDALPSFDGTTVPVDRYEIPPEALTDTKFANMIREAEKYLGYPYVWGGSSPQTSFDCSGFVCWVINHCGNGWNVGRTTAEGLRQMCSYVAPSEAKPGDIIFFQGTYDTAGASHVAIYVGDGKMIHCGNPIQYANINTSYWQQHFYMFGRLR